MEELVIWCLNRNLTSIQTETQLVPKTATTREVTQPMSEFSTGPEIVLPKQLANIQHLRVVWCKIRATFQKEGTMHQADGLTCWLPLDKCRNAMGP